MKDFKNIIIAFLVLVIMAGGVVWAMQYSQPKKDFASTPPTTNIVVTDSPYASTPATSTQPQYDPTSIGKKLLEDYTNTSYGIQFIGLPADWSAKNSYTGKLTDRYRILFVSTKNDTYCAGLDAQCYVFLAGWGGNYESPVMLGQLNWGDEPLYYTVKFEDPDKITFQSSDWWPGGEGDPPSKAENITNWTVNLKTKQMTRGSSFSRPVNLDEVFKNVVD